jgi:hypothetical protein
MPLWRYSNHEVAAEVLEESMKALGGACLKCGEEHHSDDCPIFMATSEIKALLELEER